MSNSQHYKHGLFYPITNIAPIPLQPSKVFHTEGAVTNYELWQMEKYGNYIKADGTEHIERYLDKKQTT